MGLDNIQVAGLTRVIEDSNRLLMASAQNLQAGNNSQFLSKRTGITRDNHKHWSSPQGTADQALYQSFPRFELEEGGGLHSHVLGLAVTVKAKSKTVPFFSALGDYPVVPGMIVLWDSGTLPSGWVLCDGAGSAPDLRDYFIKISPLGDEFTASGDNTIRLAGASSTVGHKHDGASSTNTDERIGFDHSNVIRHRHTVDVSGAYTPPYYALSAIMYAP
jgi:hypothetical protein